MTPADVVRLAERAIAAVDVAARVDRALSDVDTCDALVAIGKAAPLMAEAALRRLSPARTCIVTSPGTDARGLSVIRGAHPSPDDSSVAAGEAALACAREATSLVALISGGASALACAPRVPLAIKRGVADDLLAAGAPVTEVNVVRRHLSHLKGGGLAKLARGVVRTLIVSDVIDGAAWDIGSGPATPDPTTVEQARAVIARWAPAWLERVAPHLETTFPADAPDAARVRSTIVASPTDLAAAAADIARAAGLVVQVLPPSLASVDELAAEYVARAHAMQPGQAFVRVAEPSVALPPPWARGRGGRCGRLALLAWAQGLPSDATLACVASDGVDGSSGAAGAVVRGLAPARADEALAAFDDATFLARYGAQIEGAPTGTNLLDLHLLVRSGR